MKSATPELIVIHQKPGRDPAAGDRMLWIQTCQRRIGVGLADFAEPDLVPDHEFLVDQDAYAELLKFATGLLSEVKGETDVFGQLKAAWHERERKGDLPVDLSRWMQRAFEDTKEIRAQHLQHVGGQSYGTLLRRVLRTRSCPGPTLLYGAGQIAQAIAPFLLEDELWIANRSAEPLERLLRELDQRAGARVSAVGHPSLHSLSLEDAATFAANVIVAVPIGADVTTLLTALASSQRLKRVVHMGGRIEDLATHPAWRAVFGRPDVFVEGLEALFGVQSEQDHLRDRQVARALAACEEKARLRFLPGGNGGIGVAHGWEDLAPFAADVRA